ncbi:MAG TPA: hypothetical protein VGC03_02345 [Acidimicrobiia bacterium]
MLTGPIEGEGLLHWEAERFQRAANRLGLDPALTCALHCASRSVEVEIPLIRDNGTLEVCTGYRVQHSHALRVGADRQRRPWVEKEERQRVLGRLDQMWSLLATQELTDWRPTALTTAIRRVVEGMKATGIAQKYGHPE